MRRVLTAALILGFAGAALPQVAAAQMIPETQPDRPTAGAARSTSEGWTVPQARIRGQVNAGPCPYVKILYDAARYVELTGEQASSSAVGYTGEIEGLAADCRYRESDPITVDMNILFRLGKGPQAGADQRTYRYWIAVTERNNAILDKQYFDFAVDFAGSDRAEHTEEIRGLVIPRANLGISGSNFEILVGFDVTPEMAEFNRTGSRFRIQAGQ